MIPLGILGNRRGGGAAAGAYELISTTILGSNTASVTFSSLPATYKHLQLRMAVRADRTGFNGDEIYLRFNGTTSTYNMHGLGGDGTTAYSNARTSGETGARVGISSSNLDGSNEFGASVVDILDFSSSSKNKTTRALAGHAASSANSVALFSGLWVSTSAITSLTLLPVNSSNFVASSRFSLYGIKG